MNSRDRMLAVLDGKIPDRVPSFELLVDQTFRKRLHPELDFYDFQRAIGFDMVLFGLGSYQGPTDWVDRQRKIARDKWGARHQYTTETMPVLLDEPVISSESDVRNYTPPDPDDPNLIDQVRRVVKRFKGDMAIGYLGEANFAVQQYLRGGLERLMIDYATGSDLIEKVAEIPVAYYCRLYENVIREGVEVIVLGDDYAGKTGPFMSPNHFRKYIYPGLKRVVQACRQAGARVIKHTDGNLWPIFDMIMDTGVDAVGPLEDLPEMKLSTIKAAYPDKTVVGNIDIDLLSNGTSEQVRERTRQTLADAAPGGRFILSSGNSITSSVKPDLYLAMVQAKKEYGHYPLEQRTRQ